MHKSITDNTIPERIVKFIPKHHILTLATSRDNQAYCANCFYVFLETHKMFIIKSGRDTKHIKDALIENNVAGTVFLDTTKIGIIQGIQFTGKITTLKGKILSYAKVVYYKKFPYAKLTQGVLWGINLHFIKMTDNKLGFGKKLIWQSKN